MSSERLVKRRVKIKSGSGFLDAVTHRSGEDGSALQSVRVSTIDIRAMRSLTAKGMYCRQYGNLRRREAEPRIFRIGGDTARIADYEFGLPRG